MTASTAVTVEPEATIAVNEHVYVNVGGQAYSDDDDDDADDDAHPWFH